jgi:hypothetical protein
MSTVSLLLNIESTGGGGGRMRVFRKSFGQSGERNTLSCPLVLLAIALVAWSTGRKPVHVTISSLSLPINLQTAQCREIKCYIQRYRSLNSSFYIVGQPVFDFWQCQENSCLLHGVHPGSWAYPASYAMETGSLFRGVKQLGQEADHPVNETLGIPVELRLLISVNSSCPWHMVETVMKALN